MSQDAPIMYVQSVPVFRQGLNALAGILAKAEGRAEARRVAPEVMLGLRLAPDMFDVKRQVQIACDFAKNTSGRLAGAELPRFPDEEQNFAELKVRIDNTLAFIEGLAPANFMGAETRTIQFPIAGKPFRMEGQAYVAHFAMPNFWFHTTAAYAILRANGVEIGKGDFMGDVVGMTPV